MTPCVDPLKHFEYHSSDKITPTHCSWCREKAGKKHGATSVSPYDGRQNVKMFLDSLKGNTHLQTVCPDLLTNASLRSSLAFPLVTITRSTQFPDEEEKDG